MASLFDLELTRPLVFFDLESTGTRPEFDRIVEIAILKVYPDGRRESTTRRINPGMPIPPGASKVHGIYDADVAQMPRFEALAANLFRYLEDCDLSGYNLLRFDVPLLVEEFKRAGLTFEVKDRQIVDVFNIFCKLYPRTLTAAYKFFCGGELENAHSADADTLATLEVLGGQLARHPELPRSLAELAEFSVMRDPDAVDSSNRFRWSGDEVVVNFGKNYGKPLKEIAANDPSFLRWILRSDFPAEVKKIADNALIGVFPERAAAGTQD